MNYVRENYLPLGLGVVGLVLLVFGVAQMFLNKPQDSPIIFEEAKEEEKQKIMVDIEGAVLNPGVYELSEDSRIVDALALTGGMSEEADRTWVEKNINLAKKVSDGLKIYIPRTGEEVLSGSGQGDQTGPVLNINTASTSDLESLPGIGAVTAQKIIDARPYSQIGELVDRKIVGGATFEKIKDKISAN